MQFLNLEKDFSEKYVLFPFYKNDKPLETSPLWGMTLRSAGSMRFRWNEKNPLRDKMLFELSCIGKNDKSLARSPVPVELIHSKIVLDVKNPKDTQNECADGIITSNRAIMPVVTVADCVPIYFYDNKTGAYGVVHSGWKGTGIAANAIEIMQKNYGSEPKDICVAIGAHIHSCCYTVEQERADYFRKEFCEDCVEVTEDKKYRLSLQKANLYVLEKSRILSENIVILDECTCCNPIFGSNRRESPQSQGTFTVQAAVVIA